MRTGSTSIMKPVAIVSPPMIPKYIATTKPTERTSSTISGEALFIKSV